MSDRHCVFPFQFNGSQYSQCTVEGSLRPGKSWCAVSTAEEGIAAPLLRSGKGKTWDFCAEENCTDQTVGEWKVSQSDCNTVDNEICVFPFIYNNVTHHKCTAEDNGGMLWCSTETDESGHHIPGKWGNCEDDCPTCTGSSTGPDPPQLCQLSFNNEQTKAACSTHDGGDPWCNFKTGQKWGYCEDSCIGKYKGRSK